jgi:hypothetical protein
MRSVRIREFLLENLAGDLEYHPRRAILYLALAVVTHAELAELSNPFQRKSLPSIPNQAAQIDQDFDAGSLYLWPLLNAGKDIDHSWNNPPLVPIFVTGAILFLLGWLIRRLTSSQPGY